MKIYNLAVVLVFQFGFVLNGALESQRSSTSATGNIVFRSADGGQTWQDISKGLPAKLREDSIRGNSFFANEKGLFLKVDKELYQSTPNATAPFWTEVNLPGAQSSIAPAKPEIFYWGANLKKANGTSVWSPIFENFHQPHISIAFETAGGSIFIGTDRGIFKTVDNGKTWKHVHAGRLIGHLAESDGVLLATSMRNIIRSTDDGENWTVVKSEGSVAFDVKPINGGFAAITASSEKSKRSLHTSYDGGKTWQPIDTGLQNKVLVDSIWRTWNDRPRVQASMTSIIQVGENFFCTHPDGIFKSSDKGTAWKLLLPAVHGKVLNLSVSGNVIYAIASKGGC
jgi:photosystem II stability/assembly factor-like uncharacterized protein